MPRLTNPNYLSQRRNLIDYWEDEHVAWAELLPQEQWHLHDFYQPSKFLTNEQALAHRAEISKLRPSLPQQAGKAYKAIMSFEPIVRADIPSLNHIAKKRKGRKRSKDYVVRVKALARPDVDLDKLARALLAVAKDKVDRERRES